MTAWDTSARLGDLHDTIGRLDPPDPDTRHSAALTVAETAIRERWGIETVGQVLDALALRGES